MKKIILYFVFIILSVSAKAVPIQEQTEIAEQAQKLYKEKNYKDVVTQLLPLVEKEPNQEIIHFNLANAYYQQGIVGNSIYHYEKAIKINPDFKEAKDNLKFAQQLKTDHFTGSLPISKTQLFYKRFQKLTLSQWSWLAIGFSSVAFALFLLYFFGKKPLVKKLSLASMFIFLFLSFASFLITKNQEKYLDDYEYGVVINKKVELKKAPRINAETVMEIHEGTKFYIDNETDIWFKIQLANDSVGYIKKAVCKTL